MNYFGETWVNRKTGRRFFRIPPSWSECKDPEKVYLLLLNGPYLQNNDPIEAEDPGEYKIEHDVLGEWRHGEYLGAGVPVQGMQAEEADHDKEHVGHAALGGGGEAGEAEAAHGGRDLRGGSTGT